MQLALGPLSHRPGIIDAMSTTPISPELPGVSVDNPGSRWLRSRWFWGLRPGAGGAVVLVTLCSFAVGLAAPNGASYGLRARSGLVGLVFLAAGLGAVAALRWKLKAEPERSRVDRFTSGPTWRCPWPWLLVGFGAAGALDLAWALGNHRLTQLLDPGPLGTYNNLPNRHAATVVAAAITLGLCAPVLEELFFRGAIQSWIGRRFPRPLAVGIATLLFVAAHASYNSAQKVNVAAGGLAFGLLYETTKSVLPGIVAHMAANAYSLVAATTAGLRYVVPVTMVLVGAAGVTILFRHHRSAQRYAADASRC